MHIIQQTALLWCFRNGLLVLINGFLSLIRFGDDLDELLLGGLQMRSDVNVKMEYSEDMLMDISKSNLPYDGSIYDDMEYELMALDESRDDMLDLVPYYKENPLVQKAVADVKAYLSAKKEKEAEVSTISEGTEPEMTEKSKPEKEIPEKTGSKKESVLKALRERQAKIKAQEQEKPAEKSHSKKKGEQEL